jgi:hypothetical protein
MALYVYVVGFVDLARGTIQILDLPNEDFNRALLALEKRDQVAPIEMEDADMVQPSRMSDACLELHHYEEACKYRARTYHLFQMEQHPRDELEGVLAVLIDSPIWEHTNGEHHDDQIDICNGPEVDV